MSHNARTEVRELRSIRLPCPQGLLEQVLRIRRQIRRNPHDVVPMPRPDCIEPLTSIPIAATQQRLQLGQLVLKNVRRVLMVGCVDGGGRVLPGDNSISHLVCSLSEVVHVTWLDGHGVSAPWPSPFVPHIDIAAVCIDVPP